MRPLKTAIFRTAASAYLAGYGGGALAFNLQLGTMGGLLTQPGSQYYHYVRGLYGGLGAVRSSLGLRLWYLARPVHSSEGYEDQDSLLLYTAGGHVWSSGVVTLGGWAGFGIAGGYIKELDSPVKHNYRLRGIPVGIELAIKGDFFYGALSHISFTGIDGNNQFQAFVAWPFNCFTLNLGISI